MNDGEASRVFVGDDAEILSSILNKNMFIPPADYSVSSIHQAAEIEPFHQFMHLIIINDLTISYFCA